MRQASIIFATAVSLAAVARMVAGSAEVSPLCQQPQCRGGTLPDGDGWAAAAGNIGAGMPGLSGYDQRLANGPNSLARQAGLGFGNR